MWIAIDCKSQQKYVVWVCLWVEGGIDSSFVINFVKISVIWNSFVSEKKWNDFYLNLNLSHWRSQGRNDLCCTDSEAPLKMQYFSEYLFLQIISFIFLWIFLEICFFKYFLSYLSEYLCKQVLQIFLNNINAGRLPYKCNINLHI